MTKLSSVEAAAELLSISKWTVRAYIHTGKLKPVRLGRRVLLAEAELERLIAASQEPPPEDAPDTRNGGEPTEESTL